MPYAATTVSVDWYNCFLLLPMFLHNCRAAAPNMEEVSARTIVERSIRSWWFIVLAMLAGGLTGFAVHAARPPVYEAKAVFTFNIDYSLTGRLDLTEEDIALESAAALIVSTPVVEAAAAQAQAEALPVDTAFLRSHSRFDRQSESWELAVRDTDPQTALRLVELWVQPALQRLDEASLHARKAASIRSYQSSLEDCLARSITNPAGDSPCPVSSLTSLQAELANTGALLQQETAASRGFNPAVRYALVRSPELPTTPTRRGTNTVVLAGALIGLILAAWAVQTDVPSRNPLLRPRA